MSYPIGEATAIASGELRMLRLWRCNIRALHAKWIKNVLLDVRGVVLARNHLNNIPRQCQAKIRAGPSCLWWEDSFLVWHGCPDLLVGGEGIGLRPVGEGSFPGE